MRPWCVVVFTVLCLVGTATGSLAAQPAAPPAAEPDPTRVLARVNQAEITYADFKRRLEVLERERGPVAAARWRELLRALVREEILAQAAAAARLDQEAEVQTKLEQVRRQVLIEELLRRNVTPRMQVSEEELRRTYEENKAVFTEEKITASHIMVKTQAEAEAIRQELAAGTDFAELAKAKSQDTGSAEKGGDLGVLNRGQTVQEFEDAAFALKEGELSPVIKTQYGYHIIKGGPHTRAVQPYDEVKDQIRQNLSQRKQQEALVTYMGELEQAAKTEIFEDRLR